MIHLAANAHCKSARTRLTYNQMVVLQKKSEASLNQLFRALADGTRRDILARSLTETPSVSDLAARYQMSFAAVQKHVAVLERAGELLDSFEAIWRQRVAQLDDVLLPKGK